MIFRVELEECKSICKVGDNQDFGKVSSMTKAILFFKIAFFIFFFFSDDDHF